MGSQGGQLSSFREGELCSLTEARLPLLLGRGWVCLPGRDFQIGACGWEFFMGVEMGMEHKGNR